MLPQADGLSKKLHEVASKIRMIRVLGWIILYYTILTFRNAQELVSVIITAIILGNKFSIRKHDSPRLHSTGPLTVRPV